MTSNALMETLMKGRTWLLSTVVVSLVLWAMPTMASPHHAFAAEFDSDAPVELTGTVTNVEWMNPHARFYVDVEDEDGNVNNWNFELSSPNGLMRRGWRRDSMKPGDVINVSGFRAKNAPYVGNARTVTLTDGRELFAGSSFDTDN